MVKALTIIEEQVSEKVPYFRGQIPQGIEMFFGGYSSDLGCDSGWAQTQNDATHLLPPSRQNRGSGDPRSSAICGGH